MNISQSSLIDSCPERHISSSATPSRRKLFIPVPLQLFFSICLFAAVFIIPGSAQLLAADPPSDSTITEVISADGTWKFPKLRMDSNGDFYTLHWDSVNNALRFVKWNGLFWEEYTSIAAGSISGRDHISYGNEYQVNYDFDSNDNLHVVFPAGDSLASSHDAYHGVYNGSTWSFLILEDSVNIPEGINVFIDAYNFVHAVYHIDAYADGMAHVLKYATNKTGSWQVQDILATGNRGIDELHDSYVVADNGDNVTIIYRREDLQNQHQDNYYITDSDDFSLQTPIPELQGETDLKEYQVGNIVQDENDFIHLVYSNITDSTAHYLSNETGSWVQTDLSAANPTLTGAVDIAFDGADLVILTQTATEYLFQRKKDGENWQEEVPFTVDGIVSDRFKTNNRPKLSMLVFENSTTWEIGSFLMADIRKKFPWPLIIPALVLPARTAAER